MLLLLAACGKSAQVPLQSWLGDAMEGPTPVSALIHAATMVTAGVYLIVRSGPVFDLAPNAQLGVVIVGAVTLLFGAIIGCAKDDIKKALAASTMSQIGYMVLAAGLGPAGYAFAIMHLLTHGFFKAGLFLGAGSVMHGMNDEVNMRRYGGLRKALPVTFATFGLGYLAIIGVPPLAGFFSKDGIIEAALGAGGAKGCILGGAAILGAGITAFYMTRVMLMTFFGEKRWAPRTRIRTSRPPVMTWPMILLAVGSVASGGFFAIGGTLEHWLEPVVGAHESRPCDAGVGRHDRRPGRGRRRHRDRLPHVRHPSGARESRPPGRPLPWRRARTSTATRSTKGCSCGPVSSSPRDWSRSTTTPSTGPATGWRPSSVALSDGLRQLQTGFARSYALSMFAGAALVVAAILAVGLW